MHRLFFAVALAIASPASAITCHGDYQVVNGQEISTPFCRDNALADVARQTGFRVSDCRNQKQSRKEARGLPLSEG